MMKCPSCGSSMKEHAKFCDVCGARLSIPTDAEPAPVFENETGRPGAADSLAQENASVLSAQKVSLSALLRLKAVKIGIASVAAIVLACIALFLMSPNRSLPEDVVKNALKTETGIMSGIVQNDYVSKSEYELTELSVDS